MKQDTIKSTKRYVILALSLVLLVMNSRNAKAAEGNVVDRKTNQTVTELNPYTVTTGDEEDLKNASEYDIYVPNETRELVIPITVESRGRLIYSYCDKDKVTSNTEVGFYSDAICMSPITNNNDSQYADIERKGTYYLKVTIPTTVTVEGDTTYTWFQCTFVESENCELKNNTWNCSAILDSQVPLYYKIDVKSTGFLVMEVNAKDSSNLTLCSGSKKEISNQCTATKKNNQVAFAVKRGIYYVKLTSKSEFIWTRYKATSVTESSGKSKSKAKSVKIGKEKKGVVLLDDKVSKSDWYKVNLTKATKINLIVQGNVSSGSIKFEMFRPGFSGKVKDSIRGIGTKKIFKLSSYNSSYLPEGVYYIRIWKESSKTCGSYSIKVEKR